MTSNKGWNDPPKLSLFGSQRQEPTNRLKLIRKRVPIPINVDNCIKKSETDASSPLPLKPPLDSDLPCSSKQIEKKQFSLLNDVGLYDKYDDEEHYLKVEKSLLKLFQEFSLANYFEDQMKEDFLKRMEILKQAWLFGKLPQDVKTQMVLLTQALDEKNFEMAWSLHQCLIVDFTHDCSSWILGVKTVISTGLKTKNIPVASFVQSTILEDKKESQFLDPSHKENL